MPSTNNRVQHEEAVEAPLAVQVLAGEGPDRARAATNDRIANGTESRSKTNLTEKW